MTKEIVQQLILAGIEIESISYRYSYNSVTMRRHNVRLIG